MRKTVRHLHSRLASDERPSTAIGCMEAVYDALTENSTTCIYYLFRIEDALGFGIPAPWLVFKPCKSGESGLFARGAYEDIIVHQSCVMLLIEIYDEKGAITLTYRTLLRRILIATSRTIMLLG